MKFDFTEALLALIRSAGEIFRTAHEELGVNVTSKEGYANFVTAYDVKTQQFLIDGIRTLVPDAVFIAEEKENDAVMAHAEHCFVIDPIDGTTNFIYGYQHSSVSVGLLSHGEVVWGAVYDPFLGEMFHAVKGEGAFLNGRPIHVSNRDMQNGLCAFGTAAYERDVLGNATFALCRAVFDKCADLRRCGSAALDLAWLAAGRNDLFFECKLSPWDFAAGSLLIKEAGGVISNMAGDPLTFDRSHGVIAANGCIYPELLATARSVLQ